MNCYQLWVGLGLLLGTELGSLGAGPARTGPPGPLHHFSELRALSREQAQQGRPAHFQGVVVLCYDAAWGQCYLHDGTETLYLSPANLPTALEAGTRVDLTATTACADYPTLTNLHLVVQGKANLPQPTCLSLGELAREAGQWVQVTGTVRVAEASRGRLCLVLEEHGQTALLFVMGPPPEAKRYKGLVGARLQVWAVNASKLNQGRLESAMLFAPGLQTLTTLQPAPVAAQDQPVVSIDSLLNRELGSWTNQMVHLNGFVAAYEPGKFLRLKDATGSLRVNVVQVSRAQPDDWVDVWGFVSVTPDELLLRDGFFEPVRPEPPAAAPSPALAAAAQGAVTHSAITNIATLLRLSRAEAACGRPVRLEGVLTFADVAWGNAFLQTSEEAVYVQLKQADVHAGQWVEVTGQSGAGGFAPEIDKATFRVLGTTQLPAPVAVTLADLADGHLDCHWVEMQGVVRRLHQESDHLTLNLLTSRGRFKAMLPYADTQPRPTQLLGATVRVRGACGSELNPRGQLIGVVLQVPNLEQIHIEEAAPADPFATPTLPIAKVATYDPERPLGRYLKVAGTVSLPIPGQGFYLQDASGGLHVSTAQTNLVHAGDCLEVLGFPTVGEFAPSLEEAVFRLSGPGSVPPAKATTAEQIMLRGTEDGMRVQLEACLLQDVPASASPRLVLQEGAIAFTAQLLGRPAGQALPTWRSGSVLRLTGVCAIQGTEGHEPRAFRLLVAGPGDLQLVRAPSWWTAAHTLWVLGGSGLAILLAAAWIGLLRRQVQAQTELIRQKHQELLAASRQAGMAEVATSVLHNVGNVLNSVNVSAGVLANLLRQSKAQDIAKVTARLEEHKDNLAEFLIAQGRAQPLLAYLQALSGQVRTEQATLLGELNELTQHVEHIKTIVAMQQTYAKVSGLADFCSVAALVEDALRMDAESLERHRIIIERQFEPVPELLLDKHRVLQILVNLVSNAKHALASSPNPERRLTLGIRLNGDRRLRITVADNGVGIAPENLTRIFSHGFTTRKDGHGFGLHSGALAAQELGGALRGESPGPGQGAVFTLELPAQTRTAAGSEETQILPAGRGANLFKAVPRPEPAACSMCKTE